MSLTSQRNNCLDCNDIHRSRACNLKRKISSHQPRFISNSNHNLKALKVWVLHPPAVSESLNYSWWPSFHFTISLYITRKLNCSFRKQTFTSVSVFLEFPAMTFPTKSSDSIPLIQLSLFQ